MTTTYYIDSATGSDANAGTTSDTPFKSIAALNNLVLEPGDSVLLARGTSYAEQLTVKYSGTTDSPITFGAYGEGDAPMISGAATGIYSSGTHDVVVHNIAVANTTGYAVFGRNVSNWTVDSLAVSNTGSAVHSGAVSFENSSNVTVKGGAISGVTGDGMLINGGQGIVIENNQVGTVQGHNGDNVQINGVTGVTVTGNQLDMSGPTDSTKGNLVVNASDGVDIEHNTLVGGKYGASVNSDNVTIASNDIHGQQGYSWSFGIGVGENWDVLNYDIHDNTISDVAYGVALTGTSTTVERDNIDAHDNVFDHIGGAALKVDREASGAFTDNQIGSDSQATQISAWITAEGKFIVSNNTAFDSSPPDAHLDLAQLSGADTQVDGNLLSNDVSLSGDKLSISAVDGQAVGSGLTIAGHYGVVSVDANGDFVYRAVTSALAGIGSQVSDVFSYVVTDGHSTSVSKLEVDLAPGSHSKPEAVNDSIAVFASGVASGNALANDHHAYGDALHLSSVAGIRLGSAPVDIVGHYGTLSIGIDGAFTYDVDTAKIAAANGTVYDSFMYKLSDGVSQDSASLSLSIDPHLLSA